MNNNNSKLREGMGNLPSKKLLTNESEVEFNFIEHILHWLGWDGNNITHLYTLMYQY